MENIVQLEIFNVGVSTAFSLEELSAECHSRIADGLVFALAGAEPRSGIKTVVKFYDINNTMTAFVQKLQLLSDKKDATRKKFFESKGIRKWFIDRLYKRLDKRVDFLEKMLPVFSAEFFEYVINSGGTIAVETFDHSFRLSRKNELHELLEDAKKSRNVWIFVFEHNDLFSNSKLVARMTW